MKPGDDAEVFRYSLSHWKVWGIWLATPPLGAFAFFGSRSFWPEMNILSMVLFVICAIASVHLYVRAQKGGYSVDNSGILNLDAAGRPGLFIRWEDVTSVRVENADLGDQTLVIEALNSKMRIESDIECFADLRELVERRSVTLSEYPSQL
jgi:hypothetical protein